MSFSWSDVADSHHQRRTIIIITMSAVSSVIRIACRNRSCIVQHQKQCRGIPHPRQWHKRALGSSVAASSTAADSVEQTPSRCVQATTAAVLMACLAATGAVIWHENDKQQRVVQNQPRRVPSINARATNLRQFRSINERGMSQKYTVDWNVVLGEGAYGSVHPARLAATGEKVRKQYCIFYPVEVGKER